MLERLAEFPAVCGTQQHSVGVLSGSGASVAASVAPLRGWELSSVVYGV